MNDKLLEQIKADRAAGLSGPWKNTPNSGEITDEHGIYIARAIGTVTREGAANAHRIARVPDMEDRILADADRIERAEKAEAENARLRCSLAKYVYETTHLSPEESDGSHWCKISAECLHEARAALAKQEKDDE